MHLRNKLLKRYFSAEQAVVTQYEEDILRELLCTMKYIPFLHIEYLFSFKCLPIEKLFNLLSAHCYSLVKDY